MKKCVTNVSMYVCLHTPYMFMYKTCSFIIAGCSSELFYQQKGELLVSIIFLAVAALQTGRVTIHEYSICSHLCQYIRNLVYKKQY